MLITQQILNQFITTGNTIGLYKYLSVPINLEFTPIDYNDDILKIVVEEREKAINPYFDAETTKYNYLPIAFTQTYFQNNQSLLIEFKFWDETGTTYTSSYNTAGFTEQDISANLNAFKRSFFRLYFYDSNSGETNNLIFTEDITLYDTTEPILPLNRLYWLRNDDFFEKNNQDRVVYMDARFFNAKNGKIIKFVNLPNPLPTPIPITIQQYSDPNNREWRTSAITLLNPKLNNGEFNFRPFVPCGANTPYTITMTELVIQ